MGQIILIGLAAGASSALLFASFASGSLLSIPLFYLSPLPILIAALGWSHVAGLVAALVAAGALALIFGSFFFISFLLGVGLPAWWLGYLSLLARPVGTDGSATLEWYPIGRILIWAAVIASVVVALVLLTIATDEESLRATLRKAFEPLLARRAGAPAPSDNSFVQMLADHPQRVLPPAASVLTTIVTVFTLWLAGRVVRTSGRLRRPWPEISAMTFPPRTLLLLAVALVGALILSGMPGIMAASLAASLLTVYGMLGLAVVHAATAGLNGRGLILSGIYGTVIVFGWPILMLAMLAIADMAFNFRARAAARRQLPPPRE